MCGSCTFGSNCRSGGMNSARMPLPPICHAPPPSRVRQTPPHDTPTRRARCRADRRRSSECPGWSAPPPNHSSRRGSSQSGRFSSHESPPSSDLNRPPGQRPAPDDARLVGAARRERPHQLQRPVGRLAFRRRRLRHVVGRLLRILRRRRLRATSRRRRASDASSTPKCPWLSAASRSPLRGSCITSVQLSPRKLTRLMTTPIRRDRA